jgi:hypothetical protein
MLDRTDRLGLIETFKVVCPFPRLPSHPVQMSKELISSSDQLETSM